MKGAEHPDVFSAVFEFPNMMATWTLDYANSYQNGWSITFMGDKGTMILDEYGYKVFAEPWKPTPHRYTRRRRRSRSSRHIQNFMDCMKSPQTAELPGGYRCRAVAGPHLANQAMLAKKEVRLPRAIWQLSYAARIGSGPFSSDLGRTTVKVDPCPGDAIYLDIAAVLADGIQAGEKTQATPEPDCLPC